MSDWCALDECSLAHEQHGWGRKGKEEEKMKIEITPYIKELVRDYRECGCEVCAHKLATHIANRVQEAINYREEE